MLDKKYNHLKVKKEQWIKTFTDYAYSFDMNDIGISRKYYHSLRVMDIAELIAKSENFSDEDIELSILIGLLHDYARFKQWEKYKTYNDNISIDYGDLGVKLLFDDKEIEHFYLNKEYYDEIYDAIKFHNKISIKNNLSVHNNKLCKMIRDADKLDIFYIYGIDKLLFKEDNKPISEKVKKTFYQNQQINLLDILSKNDKIILSLGLVFDLNYKCSFKYLKENKLLEKMYERIENKKIFKEYFDYTLNYINERID